MGDLPLRHPSPLTWLPPHQATETAPGQAVQPARVSGATVAVQIVGAFTPIVTGCSPRCLPVIGDAEASLSDPSSAPNSPLSTLKAEVQSRRGLPYPALALGPPTPL